MPFITDLPDISKRITDRLERKGITLYKKRPKKLQLYKIGYRDNREFNTAQEHIDRKLKLIGPGKTMSEAEIKKILPEFEIFADKQRQTLAVHLAKGLIKLARQNEFNEYSDLVVALEDYELSGSPYKYILTASFFALEGEAKEEEMYSGN